jgi:hypothetical protein
MKFQKLDAKQMPQVVILGVLALGVFGYGAVTVFSASGPQPPAQQAEQPDAEAVELAQVGLTGSDAAALPPLPPSYNPDPFRPQQRDPVISPGTAAPVVSVKSEGAPAAAAPANAATSTPAVGTTPAAPVKPLPPPRPDFALTGVITAAQGGAPGGGHSEGADMALVETGATMRILHVGDLVANRYRIQRITLEGVWLTAPGDRYFVPTGNQTKE